MASVVWVWDTQKMSLEAVLEQTSAVRCFQWDPRRPRLALCTGNTRLYLWTPAGCVSVQVPTEGNRLLWYEAGSIPGTCLPEPGINLHARCLHLDMSVRWIPGPGAELALPGRRPDRPREGAALPVLHGRWPGTPVKLERKYVMFTSWSSYRHFATFLTSAGFSWSFFLPEPFLNICLKPCKVIVLYFCNCFVEFTVDSLWLFIINWIA